MKIYIKGFPFSRQVAMEKSEKIISNAIILETMYEHSIISVPNSTDFTTGLMSECLFFFSILFKSLEFLFNLEVLFNLEAEILGYRIRHLIVECSCLISRLIG